jgi:hypothetical protein
MARFILVSPVYGSPPNMPPQRFGRGRTIADSAGNAIGNDVVWPWLCTEAGPGTALSPLDAAASAQTGQSISTGPTVTVGGAGLDAGL